MKAMILAAGLGERLRPLTLEQPKPLIPVANRPLIEFNLRLLKRHGIEKVAVNLHYMGDRIQEHLGDGSRFGLRIVYSQEPALLGTGGGIKKMRDFFGEEAFVVINADILIDIDLGDVIGFHHSCKAFSTMVLRPNPDPIRYGTIETDTEGRIREFLGKVKTKQTGLEKWMFTGIHIMDPKVLNFMPKRKVFCINRDVYAQWIRSGKPCYGYVHRGYWKDLGSIGDYFQANQDILENKALKQAFVGNETPNYKTGSGVTVDPASLIGNGAVIKDEAVIGPGTIIGDRCTIGAGSRVSNSLLWPGTVIGDHENIQSMIVTRYQRIQLQENNDPILIASLVTTEFQKKGGLDLP